MGQARAARAALPLVLLLACSPSSPSPSPSASASTPPASAPPASAPPASVAASPDAEPALFDPLRDALVHEAGPLEAQAQALVRAIERKQPAEALLAYRQLRERYRSIEPAARLMAGVACSQIGAYSFFEADEGGVTGLPALGRALRAAPADWAAALPLARRVQQAARLLPGELKMQEWTARKLGFALSEAAFVLALRLDGSDSFDEAERWSDVRAELGGLGRAAMAVAIPVEVADAEAAAAIRREVFFLEKFHGAIDPARGPASPFALPVLASAGKLGAALRAGFRALGAEVSPPFRPRHGDASWPVSPLTFPALPGPAPAPADVALGKALFTSKKLSRGDDIACASCHEEQHAFARLDPPTLTFERKAPPRNAPSTLNVAYETSYFWDGRASTLATQIDVAVDRDMGGDWSEVERRLAADPALLALAEAASRRPLSAAHVREAIVAYERTLIEDQTRLDLHERGQLALTEPEARGFDLFFGKARCSRCHRLPLLSGVQPPRLRRAELSSIGAPVKPDARDLGADQGRASISHRDADRGLFKVPGLRRVAETPPYFHHGGFKTLEQVLSFYEKGGGPGLKIDVPNADPELAPLALSRAERSDLLLFLRKSLGR